MEIVRDGQVEGTLALQRGGLLILLILAGGITALVTKLVTAPKRKALTDSAH